MATGDVVKLGGFYLDGTLQTLPSRPWEGKPTGAGVAGNIPSYKSGQSIEIRDTPTSDADIIQWVEILQGKKRLLISDRVLLKSLSWNTLNARNLLFGKEIIIDGHRYLLRVLTGGTTNATTGSYPGGYPENNEWDQIIINKAAFQDLPNPKTSDLNYTESSTVLNGPHNSKWNWYSVMTWCQESITDSGGAGLRMARGGSSARTTNHVQELQSTVWMGWRPVLEYLGPVNTPPTNTPILNQSTQLGANKIVNLSSYFSDSDGDALTYTASSSNTSVGTTSVSGSILTLKPISLGTTTITVTANDGKGGTKSTTFTFSVTNSGPNVSLTSPSVNQTLYENDTFNIEGTASDTDVGNSVTVRYQINANTVRAIKAFLSDGTTIEAFSKSLRFSGGSLYDGETLIASGLTDGVAHKLKVWATDDQGGQSTIIERDFYVVPNRAPSLTIEPPVISGNIDNDKFTVNGSYNDADGNTTTVKYRVNGGNSVQVASGTSGVFDFELSIGQLIAGPNTIVVEAVDSYGSKTSKTIKLNKNVVSTEQLRSTVRYKILPPTKTAQAVLLWIERDKNLAIEVAVSMTMAGEAEAFVPVTVSESVPIANGSTTYEDTFFYEADAPKDNIIVQIDMTRQSVDADDNITLISGVLE